MIEHPTFKRAKKLAEKYGSKASTSRGVKNFLKANHLSFDNSVKPMSRNEWELHQQLDSAPVGQSIYFKESSVPGFILYARRDTFASDTACNVVMKNNPRKRNISTGVPQITGNAVQERWETIYYKGSFSGYTGSRIFVDYQSCLAISQAGKLAVVIVQNKIVRRILAPKGLRFQKDELGIKVVRLSDKMEYHPSSHAWLVKGFAKLVRRELASNYLRRKQAIIAAKKHQAFIAQSMTTRVNLYDSRLAGNCIQGSLSFAESKLKVPRSEILNAPWLVNFSAGLLRKVAKGNEAVERAISLAYLRETLVTI